MRNGIPSGTAYRVALRRAAHQLYDHPIVFADPLALRILGADRKGSRAQQDLRAPSRPSSSSLRAFLVARSRFAEDTLAQATQQNNITQYVLLGAGLDTFAYRNANPSLHVFEVDHPDTQQWKLSLLHEHNIPIPPNTAHVAVDFHTDVLAERLVSSGFDKTQPAVFAWLGVVPYLTATGFNATLDYLSTCAPGTLLLFDYGLPRHLLSHHEQLAFDSLAARVAAAGEPFELFFEPHSLHQQLNTKGWNILEDLDRSSINARYFADRTDGLCLLGNAGHFLTAQLR